MEIVGAFVGKKHTIWSIVMIADFFDQCFFLFKVPVDDGPEPGRKLTPRELVNNFWNQNPPFVGIDNMDVLNPQC